jgi:hypothetical protein
MAVPRSHINIYCGGGTACDEPGTNGRGRAVRARTAAKAVEGACGNCGKWFHRHSCFQRHLAADGTCRDVKLSGPSQFDTILQAADEEEKVRVPVLHAVYNGSRGYTQTHVATV